jgi:hypothetical protein
MEKAFFIASLLLMAGGLPLPHAADVDKGEILFQRVGPGGGNTGKSCSACHLDGNGLSNGLLPRDRFTIMGMDRKNPDDVVNVCVDNSLEGAGLDSQGAETADLLASTRAVFPAPKQRRPGVCDAARTEGAAFSSWLP